MNAHFFYWCLAAFWLGIAPQETSLLLLILLQLGIAMYRGAKFVLPSAGGRTCLALIMAILLSAIATRISQPHLGPVRIHWALVAFWVVNRSLVERLTVSTLHRFLLAASTPFLISSLALQVYHGSLSQLLPWSERVSQYAGSWLTSTHTLSEGLAVVLCWSLARLRPSLSFRERIVIQAHMGLSCLFLLSVQSLSGMAAILVLGVLQLGLGPNKRIASALIGVALIGAAGIWTTQQVMAVIQAEWQRLGQYLVLFQLHPVLGIGPENFAAYPLADGESLAPKNSLLAILITLGSVGFLAFVTFQYSLGRQLWRLRKQGRCRLRNAAAMWKGCFQVFVIFWVFAMSNNNFGDSELLILYAFHWGLMSHLDAPAKVANAPEDQETLS